MKRTRSHEIDTQAQRIFLARIPVGWVARKQDPDYGIDYEIQIFHKRKSTGIWFRIQLKGTEKYRETEDSILMPFKTDTIRYYLNKVPFPVFLVVVLTQREEIYWLFLQKYINEVLKNENPDWNQRKSVTIKIPKKNRLDNNNAAEVESEARKGMVYTHILQFGTPHWSVPFTVSGAIDDISKFEAKRRKHFAEQNEMDLQLAMRYYETENRKKSHRLIADVYERTKGESDHTEEHLRSVEGLLFFYSVVDEQQNFKIFKLSDYGRRIAEKAKDKRFTYFFRGSMLEAVFYKLAKRIQNNRLLQKAVGEQRTALGTESFLKLFELEEYRNLMQISVEYSENIGDAFRDEEYSVSLNLLIRLIVISIFRYGHLVSERTKRELEPMLKNTWVLIDNSLKLAEALSRYDMKCEILKNKAILLHHENRDEYKTVLKSLRGFASEHKLNYYVELADKLLREFEKFGRFPEGPNDIAKRLPNEEISDKEIDEMHRRLAEAAGIDLEKDEDKIANIVRIGLKDRNPERVLKNCSHLEIAVGSYGVPGEMLGLPSAGSKFLFCKYGGAIRALSLDYLYESFKRDYCMNCKYHNPMPKNWKWSLKWQKQKQENRSPQFKRFIDKVNRG